MAKLPGVAVAKVGRVRRIVNLRIQIDHRLRREDAGACGDHGRGQPLLRGQQGRPRCICTQLDPRLVHQPIRRQHARTGRQPEPPGGQRVDRVPLDGRRTPVGPRSNDLLGEREIDPADAAKAPRLIDHRRGAIGLSRKRGAHRLDQRPDRWIIFADAVLERAEGGGIGVGEPALDRDLDHLRRELVGVDSGHQQSRGVGLAQPQQQPGAFRDPIHGVNVDRRMDACKQRIAQRDMRPARGDRSRHPPHQRRQERPVRPAPRVIAEPGAARIEGADGPRVASRPAGIFDRRRRRSERSRRIRVGDFLDRGFVRAPLGQRRRG